MPRKVTDLTQERMVRNILRTLSGATEEDIAAGRQWYPAAHTFAKGLSSKYGLPHPTACAVVAVLSPQLGWGANMRAAEAICSGTPTAGVLGNSVAKAKRLLAGEDPRDVLRGNKVISFYLNILRPNEEDGAVTIDSHALAVAFGEVFNKANPAPRVERPIDYDYVAGAYRLAAAQTSYSPSVLQAIVWVAWRNTHSKYAHLDIGKKGGK